MFSSIICLKCIIAKEMQWNIIPSCQKEMQISSKRELNGGKELLDDFFMTDGPGCLPTSEMQDIYSFTY